MSAAISQELKIYKSSQDFWHLCWKSGHRPGAASGQGYFHILQIQVRVC